MLHKELQLNNQGKLQHLLNIDGLSKQQIIYILDKAQEFFCKNSNQIIQSDHLSGQTVANLFFEASTRTRSTFELAAKRLNASVLNLNISHSATSKGETLLDTVKNLHAMQCRFFVIRHSASGANHFIASQIKEPISIINAGDGWHAHPTQALLDMFTIRKHCGDFKNLCVAIIGDVLHSRVARSQIHALNILGAGEVRVIGPKTLLPEPADHLGVKVFHNLEQGLKGVNVIMMLRLQTERMQSKLIPLNNSYYKLYGLTKETLSMADKEAIIIHPGPINRGVEIQSEIADCPKAVILDQVTNGIAVRMAVLSILSENIK